MKRYLSIIVLSAYLLSGSIGQQLFKLPILISHFLEHKALDGTLGVWDFLCIHYANGSPHDSDYEKDMKLPFKSVGNHAGDFSFGLTVCILMLFVSEGYRTGATCPPNFNQAVVYRHPGGIWQPPKNLLFSFY